MNWPQHGSNPQYIYKKAGIPMPEYIVDFSANINPLGPPAFVQERWGEFYRGISDYPDPFAMNLKRQIAKQVNVLKESIFIGNGGAEIIFLLGRFLSGKKVLIIQPAFSEYEKACRANGCEIFYFQLEEPDWLLNTEKIAEKLEEVDAVFLCNPNNPTGVCFPYSQIVELLEHCQQKRTYLIIDEAFYDFLEEDSSLPSLVDKYPYLIILRSMTKMFAIPGLRLGYMLANKEVVQKVAAFQPHWSVNAIALHVGEGCLENHHFVKESKRFIREERERLFAFFEQNRFAVSPSAVNFYLLRDPEVQEQKTLFTFLLRRGIVPRHTYNFPGLDGRWLRFAIKGSEENDRLMEVLTEWRQQK